MTSEDKPITYEDLTKQEKTELEKYLMDVLKAPMPPEFVSVIERFEKWQKDPEFLRELQDKIAAKTNA